MRLRTFFSHLFVLVFISIPCSAQQIDQDLNVEGVKYEPVPKNITTPAKVKTSIGTLHLEKGNPDEKTSQILRDNLFRQRAVTAWKHMRVRSTLFTQRNPARKPFCQECRRDPSEALRSPSQFKL